MPVELMRAFEKHFGCMILEGYGLSETSPVASFNHPDRERKPGTIGQAIAGVEMRVQSDEGDPLPGHPSSATLTFRASYGQLRLSYATWKFPMAAP